MVMPAAILAGRLAVRMGHRPLIITGAFSHVLAFFWFFEMAGPTPHYFRDWLPGLLLSGFGGGMLFPSLAGAAVFGLPPQRFGVGSAVKIGRASCRRRRPIRAVG